MELTDFDQRFTDAVDEAPNQRRANVVDLDITPVRDGFYFDGYAAVFGELASIPTPAGTFTEEFRHGAFRKFLSTGANVPFLVEHDPNMLLGTTKSGRVRLTEEPRGLRVQATLADTDLSRRVKALAEAGDMDGMSVGFVAGIDNTEWERRSGGPHRIIKGVKRLIDVCATWDPAYAGAEANFRTLAQAKPESAGALQQLLMGVYPQLEQPGNTDGDEPPPDDPVVEERTSGVSGTPLLAARKRRLHLLTISLEGRHPE